MAKLDELIEELREDGREDDAKELESLRGSSLRKKAGEAEKLSKENESLKAKLEGLEKAPKIRDAFEKYGVDLSTLSKLERKAIEAYDGELDEDAIATFVEDNELPVGEEGEKPDEATDDKPAAQRVAQAARQSGEGRGNKAPKITPDDAEKWQADKWMSFKGDHPEEAEALMRGEEVVGVTA